MMHALAWEENDVSTSDLEKNAVAKCDALGDESCSMGSVWRGQAGVRDAITEALGGDQAAAKRVIEAIRACGCVCVPMEPTEAMLEEGWLSAYDGSASGVWEAMVAEALK